MISLGKKKSDIQMPLESLKSSAQNLTGIIQAPTSFTLSANHILSNYQSRAVLTNISPSFCSPLQKKKTKKTVWMSLIEFQIWHEGGSGSPRRRHTDGFLSCFLLPPDTALGISGYFPFWMDVISMLMNELRRRIPQLLLRRAAEPWALGASRSLFPRSWYIKPVIR